MDADFNVKIADFGLSSEWQKGQLLTESCGSPNYAAPELLYKDCKYEGPEVDIWSCGVVLYALLCGELPFDDESFPSLFKKIKQGRYSIPGYISPLSKDLLVRMLAVCPATRIDLPGIREHPWFKELSAAEIAEEAARSSSQLSSLSRPMEAAEAPADPVVKATAVADEQKAAPTVSRRSGAAKSAMHLPQSYMCVGSGGRLRRAYSKSASCPIGAMLMSVHA
jgi:serine/threonine protein kinase